MLSKSQNGALVYSVYEMLSPVEWVLIFDFTAKWEAQAYIDYEHAGRCLVHKTCYKRILRFRQRAASSTRTKQMKHVKELYKEKEAVLI